VLLTSLLNSEGKQIMLKTDQEPCPNCGKEVLIAASRGGKGTGDMTSYMARCECGLREDHFSDDGTKRSAVRGWNKWAREQVAKGIKKTYERPSLRSF